MKRGEIYYADLSPIVGCEQGGRRPVVIIQNDKGNKFSGATIVAVVTSVQKKQMLTHAEVGTCHGLNPNSVIMAEQIRTIDKSRIGDFIGRPNKDAVNNLDEALKISLALNKEETEKKGEEMNELQVFSNDELNLKARTILNEDGSISVNAEDTAIGFGWTQNQTKNGKQYTSIRWETLNGYCEEFGFPNKLGKDDFIPESLFYRLGMKASNAVADKFQNWLAMEVIPSIRKTGGYQQKPLTPEEMMRIQLGMIDGLGERLTKLENTMNIDYGQQRVLGEEVAKVVIDALGGKMSNAYREMSKKVFAECNHDIKDFFNVNSRCNIPRLRFQDAVDYIGNWKPCTNTRFAIDECNRAGGEA